MTLYGRSGLLGPYLCVEMAELISGKGVWENAITLAPTLLSRESYIPVLAPLSSPAGGSNDGRDDGGCLVDGGLDTGEGKTSGSGS